MGSTVVDQALVPSEGVTITPRNATESFNESPKEGCKK